MTIIKSKNIYFCVLLCPHLLKTKYLISFYRPTLKTITPTSRTQLKQQLQREQLLQENERKEAEKRVQLQQQSKEQSTNLKVPLQSIGVDVPPQVLQVRKIFFGIIDIDL